MTNKELQEMLKKYPEDATVAFEYCDINVVNYDKMSNLINIE